MNTTALQHALQRTPPHLILLLRPGRADLHLARGDALTAVTAEGFPLTQSPPTPGSPDKTEDLATFLTRVDEAFGKVRAAHPCPMVLAGPLDLLTAFADRSHHLYRLAGVLTAEATQAEHALPTAARDLVETYLLSREAEALWTLQHALTARPEHVATGIEACRAALHHEQPELLAAEKQLADTNDQHLDQLIETVIDRGGWVALTHNGTLEPHGRIALVLNPSATDHPPAEEETEAGDDGRR